MKVTIIGTGYVGLPTGAGPATGIVSENGNNDGISVRHCERKVSHECMEESSATEAIKDALSTFHHLDN